jgi:hypothetical protein
MKKFPFRELRLQAQLAVWRLFFYWQVALGGKEEGLQLASEPA